MVKYQKDAEILMELLDFFYVLSSWNKSKAMVCGKWLKRKFKFPEVLH